MQIEIDDFDDRPIEGGATVSLAICALVCTASWCLGLTWASGGIYEMFILLNRPIWALPRPWLIDAWSALHVAMTVSVWRLWRLRFRDQQRGVLWFMLYLLFALLWPYVHFEQKRGIASLVFSALAWGTTVAWMASARRVSRTATVLTFACSLWWLYIVLLVLALIIKNPLNFSS